MPHQPLCAPPLNSNRRPRHDVPAGGWDCHCHLFGDLVNYPPDSKATHTAPEATLADYRRLLDRLGLACGVFVTSTVYGTDNRLLEEALTDAASWLRGIAVIDDSITDDELETLHARGVRGFRVNLMQGSRGDHFRGGVGPDVLEPLARRTADLGWHAQLWCDSRDLDSLAPRLRSLPVDCVIDHFGRTPAERGADDAGYTRLIEMARAGEIFVKISGVYRISSAFPHYPDVDPMARRLIAAAPDRLVWGTDWPHPNFAGEMPDDADLLDILFDWCDNDARLIETILVDTPKTLYGVPGESKG